MEIDSVHTGKVTGITEFGAYVKLDAGGSGMVHISEISHAYVETVRGHLEEGQEVTVKVIGVNQKGKAALSIKQTTPPPSRRERKERKDTFTGVRNVAPATFEDKLKAFMKDSEGNKRESYFKAKRKR